MADLRGLLEQLFSPAPPPNDELALRNGRQAEQEYGLPSVNRAFVKVKMGIIEKWAKSPVSDHEVQRTLRLMLKLVEDVESNIFQEIRDGKVSDATIQRERAKESQKKRGS